MAETPRQPSARGQIILDRLEELSMSMAEIERRSHLSKNTISNAIYGPRSPQRKTIEILAEVIDLPVETLTQVLTQEAEPVSFEGWLFRPSNRLLWLSLLGAAVTGLFLSQGLWDQTVPRTVPRTVQGIQFLVILLLLTMLPRLGSLRPGSLRPGSLRPGPRRPGLPEHDQASHQLEVAANAALDFRRYWGSAWLCWVFLYFALTVTTWLGFLPLPTDEAMVGEQARISLLLLNFLQNCGTVLLFLCYEVVARPTIKDDFSRKQVLPTEAWFALVALISIAEGIVLGVLSWEYQQWFGWISGFGQGMALALLVGRFDSKYVDPPAIVVGSLYLYAVIQGAWPVFRYESELMLVLTFLALVLKCLLFLFVSWLFESDVILFYLGRMRGLDQNVRRDRAEFLKRYRRGTVENL